MARKNSVASGLAERVLRGESAAASRALTHVIDESPEAPALLKAFFVKAGTVPKIGLCGPPGAGKSTLLGRLVGQSRKRGLKVGVLAVDPSSHLSGGAFLGDRLRIQEHALDSGVFIRSVATRGMVGGVSHTIFGAVHVLEAYGCDRIFIETVGTGQDEVEIARVADTVLYVTTPQLGDEIQAMKAGAMEIGDCFVVNKADLSGSDKAVRDLKAALALGAQASPHLKRDWDPPVMPTSATTGAGVEALDALLDRHWKHLRDSGEGRRRLKAQLREEVTLFLSRRIYRDVVSRVTDAAVDELAARKTDPSSLGLRILKG